MSFAVWNKPPPFTFQKDDREQIYQVGNVWIVTDDPLRATIANVDAVLNPTPAPKSISDGQLAALLVRQNVITQDVIDAAVAVIAQT